MACAEGLEGGDGVFAEGPQAACPPGPCAAPSPPAPRAEQLLPPSRVCAAVWEQVSSTFLSWRQALVAKSRCHLSPLLKLVP